ncbi:hypothetical protein SAICODRAFT_111277 [Saitoella complicata NRRL Y-17804]|uniref:uncharacterized protein n=1 Tax=Saitoella complicata (strain BCRC 22490 / CBS 7301 / JCM 7358 / NBRC 10748 / NRRL Y-17804) TaxID=698492 RepID=UPI0008672B8F|nr:uncharacterized protein SAICODRAFT_111277 [Saitoella complicata NRRL Y-17804]ODQ56598.1 hypothetical protein SAICODRAFT_111277 [Saitoella complicata NRRL Y-17804]
MYSWTSANRGEQVVIYDFYFCSTLLYSTLVYDFLDSHSTTIIYTYTTTLTKQTNNMQLITAFTSTSCLFPHLSLPHPFSSTSTPSSPTFASPSTLFAPTHNTSRVFCLFTLPLRLAYSASTLPFRVIRAAGAVLEGENGDAWLEADLGVDEDVEGKKKEKVLKKVRFRGVDIFRKQLSDFRFSSAPSSSLAEVEHDVCWGELGCMTLLPSDFVHLGASTQIFVCFALGLWFDVSFFVRGMSMSMGIRISLGLSMSNFMVGTKLLLSIRRISSHTTSMSTRW